MPEVRTVVPTDADYQAVSRASFDLAALVWPPEPGQKPRDPSEALARWADLQAVHFVLEQQDRLLAHAMLFRREIFTPDGPLTIGALASVCVHPDFRGNGWGADVVRAAFDYLPELGVEVSLYQTGVPQFYEKLGAKQVSNRITSSHDPSGNNPFWDTHVMVYPASHNWPEGEIDLNGAGY